MKKTPKAQTSIEGFRHGGLREGAGRPNVTGEPAHLRRPQIEDKICADILFVLKEDLPNLRKEVFFRNFKKALGLSAQKGWRLLQFSFRAKQINLLVECDDNKMLESCTKSFGTSLSKRLNLLNERSGPVFKGRYRIEVIHNPDRLKSIVKSHYSPKNILTEAPKFYLSWNAPETLQTEEGVKNVLRGPSLQWLKVSFKTS